MRAYEFLIEKNLEKSDFYKKDRLLAVISKLEKGEEFEVNNEPQKIQASPDEMQLLKSFLSVYDDAGNTRKEVAQEKLPNKIGGIPWSKIAKTDDLGGRSSAKKGNLGPVVELLKAVALFAKLTDRTNNPISAETIKSIIEEVKKNSALGIFSKSGKSEKYKSELTKEVPDFAYNVKDTLSLRIVTDKGPFLRATEMKPEDKQLQGNLTAILNYVNNEKDLEKYNNFFSKNGRKDSVKVDVVGGEGSKTDIRTTYIDPVTGKSRTLKNLSMSLKAANSQIDQAPGTNEDGIRKFFGILGLSSEDANQAMKSSQYVGKSKDTATPEDHVKRSKAVANILKIAGDKLEQQYFSKNDKGEAQFVNEFLGNLTKAMTKEESLIYVNFNANGTYKKLNPRKIMDLAATVDLTTSLKISEGGVYNLYITDTLSGKNLFKIRLMISLKERIAFFFELEKLLELVYAAQEKSNKLPATTQAEPKSDELTAIKKNAGINTPTEVPNEANPQ